MGMMRASCPSLAALLLLTGMTAAHAEYRLRLVEIDEGGMQVAHSAWTCPAADKTNECRHQIELTLAGRRQPVEFHFTDNNGIADFYLIANGDVLVLVRPKGLQLKKGGGPVAGSFEVWANQRRNGVQPLVDRRVSMPETIGLAVEKSIQP
jgi:hypothetical protein